MREFSTLKAACLEVERLEAEVRCMADHCRTIDDALGVGCIEDAVVETHRLKAEVVRLSTELKQAEAKACKSARTSRSAP